MPAQTMQKQYRSDGPMTSFLIMKFKIMISGWGKGEQYDDL